MTRAEIFLACNRKFDLKSHGEKTQAVIEWGMRITPHPTHFLILLLFSFLPSIFARSNREFTNRIDYGASMGKKIFFDAALGKNGLSCASCHHIQATEDNGLLKPGPKLLGKREFYKNNRFFNMMGAANDCLEKYMLGKKLTRVRRAYLSHFFEAQRKGVKKAIEFKPTPRINLLAGNLNRGRKFFFAACNQCHPNGRTGIGPALFGLGKSQMEIAKIIRHGISIPENSKTPMPFFNRRIINDRILSHISAYVSSLNIFDPRAN
ncbi:c-type cytochrome [Candidatus Riflebacteria bacterium]